MTKPLQVIAIGGGYFAQFQLEAWHRLPQVRLAAIADRDADKRAALKTQYPDALISDSLASAAQQIDADIVDIITPSTTHQSQVYKALKLCPNAAIICQKPFCGSIDVAQEVTLKAANLGRTLLVHENFRFQPWYRVIKSLLCNNDLGQVLQASFRLRPGDGQGANAYLDRQPYFQKMPRFLIHETGIHWVDVFRYLFGEPQALTAELRRINPHIAGEDAGHFIFHYDNGLRVQFDGNRHIDHPAGNTRHTMGEMLIEGTQATLSLNGEGEIRLRHFGQTKSTKLDYEMPSTGFGADCVYQLQAHVVSHLLKGSVLQNTASDYLKNMQLEEYIYQAAKSQSLVNVQQG